MTLGIVWMVSLLTSSLFAQGNGSPETGRQEQLHRDYKLIAPYFEEAYLSFPSIPRGILEAISYQYRRFSSLEPEVIEEGAHSIPTNYTVMGLTLDGKGVFRENLRLVERLSSYEIPEILSDPRMAILAYAKAFASLQASRDYFSENITDYCPILIALSELPYDPEAISWETNYPIHCFLYEVFRFLADPDMAEFTHHVWEVDFERLFGPTLVRLRQKQLGIQIKGTENVTGADYGGASWLPAASCNYTQGRNGTTVTGITIHYTQGTYAGTLAWFQNCNANASAHYIIRSSDGQVTQMVREQDKAWHVGVANSYTIGVEHEAYGNIVSYFTEAMYQSSAALVRDICQRHPNINPHRTFYRDTLDDGTILNSGVHSLGGSTACTQIRGHQHYPSQTHTDPGPYWNWNHYYHLINSQTSITTDTAISGTWHDSGGPGGPYGANEHQLFLIQRPDADSITLDFSQFDVETNYDFLWIYDGNSLSAPLLGRWNTMSPGHIVSSGPAMLIEFRSDCATQDAGWEAHWNCHQQNTPPAIQDSLPPATAILHDDSTWITKDFVLHFADTDDQQILHRFWQVMELTDYGWQGDPSHGFLCDNFDTGLDMDIWQQDGHWFIDNQKLTCSGSTSTPRRIFARHCDGSADCFLYDFYLTMAGGDSCSFYFHLQKDAVMNPWQGFEICFENSRHRVSIYQITDGSRTLLGSSNPIYFSDNTSYLFRVLWDTAHHRISLFRHQNLLAECHTGSSETGSHERHIGFRCHEPILIDNLRIYAGRGDSIVVSVGSADTCLMHAQASQGVARCKVKSVIVDEALHFSSLAEKSVSIDYTPPPAPTRIETPLMTDNTARIKGIPVYAQWEDVVDEQSGLANYEYILNLTMGNSTCLRETIYTTTSPHTEVGLQVSQQCLSCTITIRSRDHAGNLSGSSHFTFPLRQ